MKVQPGAAPAPTLLRAHTAPAVLPQHDTGREHNNNNSSTAAHTVRPTGTLYQAAPLLAQPSANDCNVRPSQHQHGSNQQPAPIDQAPDADSRRPSHGSLICTCIAAVPPEPNPVRTAAAVVVMAPCPVHAHHSHLEAAYDWSRACNLGPLDCSSPEHTMEDHMEDDAQEHSRGIPGTLRLTPEQLAYRQDSVQRYRQKRAARQYSQKVRYESRREVAQSRARFQGRFISNRDATPGPESMPGTSQASDASDSNPELSTAAHDDASPSSSGQLEVAQVLESMQQGDTPAKPRPVATCSVPKCISESGSGSPVATPVPKTVMYTVQQPPTHSPTTHRADSVQAGSQAPSQSWHMPAAGRTTESPATAPAAYPLVPSHLHERGSVASSPPDKAAPASTNSTPEHQQQQVQQVQHQLANWPALVVGGWPHPPIPHVSLGVPAAVPPQPAMPAPTTGPSSTKSQPPKASQSAAGPSTHVSNSSGQDESGCYADQPVHESHGGHEPAAAVSAQAQPSAQEQHTAAAAAAHGKAARAQQQEADMQTAVHAALTQYAAADPASRPHRAAKLMEAAAKDPMMCKVLKQQLLSMARRAAQAEQQLAQQPIVDFPGLDAIVKPSADAQASQQPAPERHPTPPPPTPQAPVTIPVPAPVTVTVPPPQAGTDIHGHDDDVYMQAAMHVVQMSNQPAAQVAPVVVDSKNSQVAIAYPVEAAPVAHYPMPVRQLAAWPPPQYSTYVSAPTQGWPVPANQWPAQAYASSQEHSGVAQIGPSLPTRPPPSMHPAYMTIAPSASALQHRPSGHHSHVAMPAPSYYPAPPQHGNSSAQGHQYRPITAWPAAYAYYSYPPGQGQGAHHASHMAAHPHGQ